MPLLEEAKMSELVDFIGESLKEAEAEESAYEDGGAQEEEVGVDSSEASEDVNEEDASPSDTEEDVKEEPGDDQDVVEVEAQDSEPVDDKPPQKDSKWIPRDRLNEVNDKWRQREQQLLVQLGALEERAKQAASSPAPQKAASDDDWLDELMGDDSPAPPSADIEQLKATQLKVLKWQEEFTRQQIYKEFNTELQVAMERYPDIPEDVFRDAVVRNGSVNMIELGEALSTERSSLVEKWKADWTKSNPTAETPEPEAVRRPSRRSSAQPAVTSDKPKSFSTIREAGDAMASEMADFFENLQQ